MNDFSESLKFFNGLAFEVDTLMSTDTYFFSFGLKPISNHRQFQFFSFLACAVCALLLPPMCVDAFGL
jgi:hypothetical protein